MTMKLILATALSLGLGSAALAQTDTTATADQNASIGGMGSMPTEWQGAIGDAFYSDTAAGTLRSQAEIESNWANLSVDQQAQVRDHCATVDTASAMDDEDTTAGSDFTAGTDTTIGSDVTAGTDTTAGSDVTAGTNTGAADPTITASTDMNSMAQLCSWVGDM